jgi:hypothetical protein
MNGIVDQVAISASSSSAHINTPRAATGDPQDAGTPGQVAALLSVGNSSADGGSSRVQMVTPRTGGPRGGQGVIDFSRANTIADSTVISACSAKILSLDGKSYYVKNIGDSAITRREVAAAQIYRLFAPTPQALLVGGCHGAMGEANGGSDKIYAAFELDKSYQDLGDFMIDPRSADEIAWQFPEEFGGNAGGFRRLSEEASALTSALKTMRDDNPADWWKGKDGDQNQELVNRYKPLAERLDEVIGEQISLLPESLRKQMQTHVAVSQLVNDWDPINPFYRNVGFARDGRGELLVMRLDFGSCLDVGFRGLAKEDSYLIAVGQRPAAFPDLKHVFKEERATFSGGLPGIATDYEDFPYADVVRLMAGDPAWVRDTRCALASQCLVLKQSVKVILDRNLGASESAPQLRSSADLIGIMEARMDAVVEQSGGLGRVMQWQWDNPEATTSIKAKALRAMAGTSLRPSNASGEFDQIPNEGEGDVDESSAFIRMVRNADILQQERSYHRAGMERRRLQALRRAEKRRLEAKPLHESRAALRQSEWEAKECFLEDLRSSLQHGTVLKDETPESSALLLAPHVLGTLDDLPDGIGVVLLDNQDRYWRYVQDGDVLLRTICAAPAAGDIVIRLPRRPLSGAGSKVTVRRLEEDLPEDGLAEMNAPAYGAYAVCIAPGKWRAIDAGAHTQHGQEERLFSALATGLNLARGGKTTSNSALSADADALRDGTYRTVFAKPVQDEASTEMYRRHQEELLFLEASETFWQALNSGFETKLNTIYVIDSVYRTVLNKLADSPASLATLLTEDRSNGYTIDRKLAEIAGESYVQIIPSARLDPDMDRFLQDHLSVLSSLNDAGFLSDGDVAGSLARGRSASLGDLFDRVGCSPDLEGLARRLRGADASPGASPLPPRKAVVRMLLADRIRMIADSPVLTDEEATERYEDSKPADPRESPYYRQAQVQREKEIRALGFNADVAREQVALEHLAVCEQFDSPVGPRIKEKAVRAGSSLEERRSRVEKAVEKNRDDIAFSNVLTGVLRGASGQAPRVQSSSSHSAGRASSSRREHSLHRIGPPSGAHFSGAVTRPRDPQSASRDAQDSGASISTRPPSLASIPSSSTLSRPQPATAGTSPAEVFNHAQVSMGASLSMSSLPSVSSLASPQPLAPQEGLRQTQAPVRGTVSMSSLPSVSSLASSRGVPPENGLLQAQASVRGAVSMSSLPSTNRIGGSASARSDAGSFGSPVRDAGANRTLSGVPSALSLSPVHLSPLYLRNSPQGPRPMILPPGATIDGSTVSIPAQVNLGGPVKERITLHVKTDPRRPVVLSPFEKRAVPGLAPDPSQPRMHRQPSLPTLTEVDRRNPAGLELTFNRGGTDVRTFIPAREEGTVRITSNRGADNVTLVINPNPLSGQKRLQ